MPDRQLLEDIANRLNTDPALIEKDWHVVRALGVLVAIDDGDVRPVFSGGTSLSIGWGLIKRFSEDVDFKVAMPPATTGTAARNQRRDYREKVLAALGDADYRLTEQPHVGNESRFFTADLAYPTVFTRSAAGLRPHLRVEMTFQPTVLAPIAHPIRSLVAREQNAAPEIAEFLCVDPVETAADKLSALAWRACVRDRARAREGDDPTVIRHLHDLAALEHRARAEIGFATALGQAVAADEGRGGAGAPVDPRERFDKMLARLNDDPLWTAEYDQFVEDVSFAGQTDRIPFADALAAVRRLVQHYLEAQKARA